MSCRISGFALLLVVVTGGCDGGRDIPDAEVPDATFPDAEAPAPDAALSFDAPPAYDASPSFDAPPPDAAAEQAVFFSWEIQSGGAPSDCAKVGADTVGLLSTEAGGSGYEDIYDCTDGSVTRNV